MPEKMSWEAQWREAVSNVTDKCTYQEGASILREIMRTGLLKMTDIRDNPDRFFLAHRILAEKNSRVWSWILDSLYSQL